MVADLQALNMNTGTLSVLTSGNGGIIDDLIVARTGEESFYVVANAGCADKDLLHLRACQDRFSEGGSSVCLSVLDDRSLIAYQGPAVVSLLEALGLHALRFMSSAVGEVCGVPQCRITRCGYT
jgi:aminomethyltransferase